MKQIISFSLILFSLGTSLFAQDTNPLEQAKFNLIKNAVGFYSEIFKKSNDCQSSKDFNSLSECVKKEFKEKIERIRK